MRIDRTIITLLALALAAGLVSAACNEADGTDPWPGAYPPEADIDRPKGGDAGRDAAASEEDAAPPDAEAEDDAAPADAEAEQDADASDAGSDAASDATPEAG